MSKIYLNASLGLAVVSLKTEGSYFLQPGQSIESADIAERVDAGIVVKEAVKKVSAGNKASKSQQQ